MNFFSNFNQVKLDLNLINTEQTTFVIMKFNSIFAWICAQPHLPPWTALVEHLNKEYSSVYIVGAHTSVHGSYNIRLGVV